MITSERVRKLFSSPIFLFVYFSLSFGVIMQLMMHSEKPFSWAVVALFGVPSGLLMTIFTVRGNRKLEKSTGLADPKQRQKLYLAVKSGKAPSSPQIRKALPGFLHNHLKTNEKARKYGMALAVAVGGSNLLLGLGGHNTFRVVLSAVFLIGGAVVYFFAQKAALKYDSLYRQMKVEPSIPMAPPLEPSTILGETIKSFCRFAASYFGLVIIVVGVILSVVNPHLVLLLGLPIILVGLLLLVPYHLLPRSWAKIYAGILLLAIAATVLRLHVPVGSSMTVPAHMPLPERGGPLGYALWAVLHSSIVLVVIGVAILLDVMARRSKNDVQAKTGWAPTVVFIMAAIFFSGSINFNVRYEKATNDQAIESPATSQPAEGATSDPQASSVPVEYLPSDCSESDWPANEFQGNATSDIGPTDSLKVEQGGDPGVMTNNLKVEQWEPGTIYEGDDPYDLDEESMDC